MTVHHRYDRERHDGGSLNDAISSAMVGVVRHYAGRGSTIASTTVRENTVIVTLENTLTRGEQSLVDSGRREEALRLRAVFEGAMRAEASAVVEGLTGRTVVAMVSADHIDPVSTGEVFVLDATLKPRAKAVG